MAGDVGCNTVVADGIRRRAGDQLSGRQRRPNHLRDAPNNVECTYTPAGGSPTYKPFDGAPEVNCDRREPKYVRLVLTPKSFKRFDDIGDQGCCGTSNPLPYGSRWSKGPFTCASAESGLTCKRSDGRGFSVSRERIDVF
jgi:hypothetical protein